MVAAARYGSVTVSVTSAFGIETGSAEAACPAVDVRAPIDNGVGKLGVSVWRFAKRPVCYGTSLIASDAGWNVASWGIVVAACTGVQ